MKRTIDNLVYGAVRNIGCVLAGTSLALMLACSMPNEVNHPVDTENELTFVEGDVYELNKEEQNKADDYGINKGRQNKAEGNEINKGKQKARNAPVNEFNIVNVKFYDVVNNIYIPNVDGVYERGSRVHIVTLVEDLMKVDMGIIAPMIDIWSPSGKPIKDVSSRLVEEERTFEDNLLNLKYSFLTLESDVSGEYLVRVALLNVKKGYYHTKKVKFSIK